MQHLRLTAFLLVSSGLAAQTTIPSAAATRPSNHYDPYVFYGNSNPALNQSRTQWIYCTTDIPVAGLLVQSLQLRRPSIITNTNRAATWTCSIDMSISPADYTAASSTFAANHGPNRVTVFTGTLSLPANSGATWPAPWLPAIPLGNPFVYAQPLGRSLVVDFATSNGSSGDTYVLEAQDPGPGQHQFGLSSCRFARGGSNASMSFKTPSIGGTWYCKYHGYPTNEPSFNISVQVIGQQAPGGTWAGRTLPIALASLGIPVLDPTCALATDVVLTTPLTYDAGSGSLVGPTISIPHDPSLGGSTFYSQAISVDTDPLSGATGVHASRSNKWTITDAAIGATVYGIQSAAKGPNGVLLLDQVGTLRLVP